MTGILESLVQTEECSICGDVADGYHYGVLSCRGCNAFFRRAITYGLAFTCRRDGNCRVDKNARCACRACRLKKCEKVGMDRRAVQPKRNNNKIRNDVNNEMSRCKTESECSYLDSAKSSAQPSPSTADFSLASPLSAFQITNIKDEQMSPMSSTYEYQTCQNVIARLVIDYKLQRSRRRTMLCTSVEEMLCDELEDQLRKPAEGRDVASNFRVQVILMFEWVSKLEEFRKIRIPQDKSNLLRSFAVRYLLLDDVFHTIELGIRDKIVLVNNSFITPGHIPPFFPGESADSRTVKLMMYGDNSFRMVEELIVPMVNMQCTVGELMALRLIIFWNPSGVVLDPSTSQIVQDASDTAIRSLNRWYIEQNFENVDARLSTLLLLIPPLAHYTQTLSEMVKLIPSFGLLNEYDSSFQDILAL